MIQPQPQGLSGQVPAAEAVGSMEGLTVSPSSRRAMSSILAISMAITQVALPVRAQVMNRADYEACQAGDEVKFKSAVEAITVKALQRGVAGLDFNTLVAEEWRRAGMDEILDKRVEIAVTEVKDETSWGKLIQSLGSRDKAQELATAVAERVYRSDAVKAGLETLTTGVGKQVGKQIEIAVLDAAQPAMQCLQAFLGPRYGTTVARVVTQGANKEFVDPAKGSAPIGAGTMLAESSEGLAGAVVLMVRRQLANMASRLGQRLVGSVLSRLVSLVAGGIGVALLAKELWDLRHGVMPIIASEMKGKETKDKVKEELARSISEQISEHMKEIGAQTAERIVDVWQEFRRAHAKVLELAERSEKFRRFVDTTRADNLPRLDEMVAILLAEEGEPGVLRRLDDGTLQQIVNVAPAAAIQIARETRSVEAALKWNALAGNELPKVIDHELHRRTKPDQFTRTTLARILGLDDRIAVARVASITPSAREALLEIEGKDLKALARALAENELETLASYLTGLPKEPRERILKAVAQSPGRMQILASARVRDAILGSGDQSLAVTMMLRNDTGFDLNRFRQDAQYVLDGKVKPILLWDRHPIAVAGAGALALVLLMMIQRLFSTGRRPRPAGPAGKA